MRGGVQSAHKKRKLPPWPGSFLCVSRPKLEPRPKLKRWCFETREESIDPGSTADRRRKRNYFFFFVDFFAAFFVVFLAFLAMAQPPPFRKKCKAGRICRQRLFATAPFFF